MCVSRLNNPARNVHASYYIVFYGLFGSTIFLNYLINGKIFGEKITDNKMCVGILYKLFFKKFSL